MGQSSSTPQNTESQLPIPENPTTTTPIESSYSSKNTIDSSLHPSKNGAKINSLTVDSINPHIRNEYIQSAQVDVLDQVLRIVSNNCMHHCQISQFDQKTHKTNYPNENLSYEQTECMQVCSKKMIEAFQFVSEKYVERISQPGSTVYLGLNENIASTFRV